MSINAHRFLTLLYDIKVGQKFLYEFRTSGEIQFWISQSASIFSYSWLNKIRKNNL